MDGSTLELGACRRRPTVSRRAAPVCQSWRRVRSLQPLAGAVGCLASSTWRPSWKEEMTWTLSIWGGVMSSPDRSVWPGERLERQKTTSCPPVSGGQGAPSRRSMAAYTASFSVKGPSNELVSIATAM